MEAVPKLPLISFELKTSPETTHFGPKLKQYISEAYREDPDSYSDEIHQLECLRASAVRPTIDEAGLNSLYRYFSQLLAMRSRFPMTKGQSAAVPFAWKDLYANMTCAMSDVQFEMACILYNIGALHTQLGASEPRTNPDSLKATCLHYQNAAWAFQYIKEAYPQPPGVDVSTDIMRLFQEICFAQAQECILDKSIQDTKKASVVGAVASQVLFFYKNSLAILGPSTGTDNIHEIIGTKIYNYWHRYLSFKSSYIGCIVCLYQGMNAEEQQKMGERVAFYQVAADRLAEAHKLAKYIEPKQVTQEALTFTNDVVEGKRKAAKNENEFIYHEEVPEKDFLSDLKPVCLVKAVPINFSDEVSGPDLFSRLVPLEVLKTSSLYSEVKAQLLRDVLSQAEAKDMELMEFMSSLHLDQLDVIGSEQRIPQEIVDRCAAMNAKTEIIQSLVDSMNNLAEIISDVEHALAECKNYIQEETSKEKDYQKQMGPRPPSIVQTELSREFHKYQEAHARTSESNQVLHKAMTLHIANLRLLALPLDELTQKIPNIENIEGLDLETMAEMRRVVGKAREMQKQRETLIQELREDVNNDDVTGALLTTNSKSHTDAQKIFEKKIEKHTPKVRIIEQNLSAQENIINKLTSLYASYGESRRMLADVLRKRDALINALITSYDTYGELLGKCQKGLEFYRKLSHNVTQLLARLRSTCQVQDEERTQMLAKQGPKASHTASASAVKPSEVAAQIPTDPNPKPKLKDYLPYMKSRAARSVTPQIQPEVPADTYYPESIYPTSARPTPVGSEATSDPVQMKYPDGYTMPSQSPNLYNPYANQYGNEMNPYMQPGYAYASKSMGKLDNEPNYGYSAYTPPQYSSQTPNTQSYNPYYTATQDNATIVTDTQNVPYNTGNVNPNMGQYTYDQYGMSSSNQVVPIPDAMTSVSGFSNQTELTANFAQMHVATSVSETKTHVQVPHPSFGSDYSQTYYSIQYPQANTPNMSTYSSALNHSSTSSVPSQLPSDYSSLNYPYGNEPNPGYMAPVSSTYDVDNTAYSYASTSQATPTQGYPIYTNADTMSTHSSQSINSNISQAYAVPEPDKIDPSLSQIDAMDMPIKSHVTGQALSVSYQPTFHSYDPNFQITGYSNQADQSVPPNSYAQSKPEQANVDYSQGYQNHPGYNYNATSGNYEYNYGSQNSFTTYTSQENVQPYVAESPNMSQGVYTSAGISDTVQSPSNDQQVPQQMGVNNQMYYNTPYGYQTMQPNEVVAISQPMASDYSANANQSTYMQSGHQDSAVTYSNNNQVATPMGENVPDAPNSNQNYQIPPANYHNQQAIYQNQQANYENHSENYQNQLGSTQNQLGSTHNQLGSTQNQPIAYHEQSGNYQNIESNNKTVPINYANTPSNVQTVPDSYQVNPENYQHTQENYHSPSGNYQNNSENYQPKFENTENIVANKQNVPEVPIEKVEIKPEIEPSNLDLLSDIDFTVEQTPLKPEIKVPQISESAIKKPILTPKSESPKIKPKVEESLERPAKRDLFSDPNLLNKYTEEVKRLQKYVDSFTNRTPSGLTVLDAQWKMLQDVQLKENMVRSKTLAMQNSSGNILTEVVPFDDTRLTLKSDPDVYINASYYKQLAPWCIPLVISKSPVDSETTNFWTAILENKISCIVCLISELEMQGQSYWPTQKGQSLSLQGVKVTLEEVTCNVHWTERKFAVTDSKTVVNVSHYQINVYPAKILCLPLLLLASETLRHTYDNRASNQLSSCWVHCQHGAGRSAVFTLLLTAVCQVRAGHIDLCHFMETSCVNLYKHRSNVLEETKYLADAYRAVLFYVQGTLCAGTTMFNGETVSVQTGASVLPPVNPSTTEKSRDKPKFSKESFEEMRQSPGLKSGDMKDPLNFLDPLWSLKKK